jgi:SAM-dependent methyltransferase
MTTTWVFDAPHYQNITRARLDFTNTFLPDLVRSSGLLSALDAGCGIGDFSPYLASLSLETTGIDARAVNITEAARRYPNISFATHDIESSEVLKLGVYDLVFCYGLLYHLENPVAAIRNLHALTGHVLLIESMVIPDNFLEFGLVMESTSDDQGIRYMAVVPSERSLIKTLYQVGFPYVYSFRYLPDHDDFRKTRLIKRRRTCLLAAHKPISLRQCVLAPNPEPIQYWRRPIASNLYRLQLYVLRLLQRSAVLIARPRHPTPSK